MTEATKTPAVTPQTIAFSSLPKLGEVLDSGTFHGVITTKDGTHAAVVLLSAQPSKRMTWQQAIAWAKKAGGQLASRPVAALLYANAKPLLKPTWHWTSDELQTDTNDESDASYAWYCFFGYGSQYYTRKSAEGAAVAVRLIPLSN